MQDVSAIRAVERTKDLLVRMLAHDMNNPLTVIQAAIEAIEEPADRSRLAELQPQAAASMHRLQRMVVNLHDLTTPQTSAVPLSFEDVDLGELVRQAADDCDPPALRRGVAIDLELPVGAVVCQADGSLVRRALCNLLENAVRFSPRHGRVVVRLTTAEDTASIEVVDRGPGVPAELRAEIFRPFVAADALPAGSAPTPAAGRAMRPHLGLGLALVDLVATEHGGGVEVTCPDAGGSVFTLTLPRRQSLR